MELSKKQVAALKEFAEQVCFEEFSYACMNYPLKDKELHSLICKPVSDAEKLFETLCAKYKID